MLICKSAASFVGDPAVELFVIYSFGLCSCSEMNVCLQENLSQRGIDLEMMKNPRIFLSDAVLSLHDLFASLCYLHQTEGERSTVVLLDSWLLFQANTMSSVKIARAISQLRKLAENLDLKIILAVHTPSTDDFPKMGIMC